MLDKLLPAIKDSAFDTGILDISYDIMETQLDSFLHDGVLKELPVIKTMVSLYKTGIGIKEIWLLNNYLVFIQQLRSGTNDPEKLKNHKKRLEDNPKQMNRELSYITVLLDKHIDRIQSEILAMFYVGFIDKKIDWLQFCELSEANYRMFSSDYELLLGVYSKSDVALEDDSIYIFDRLSSLGLIHKKATATAVFGSDDEINNADTAKDVLASIELTPFGNRFCDLIEENVHQANHSNKNIK